MLSDAKEKVKGHDDEIRDGSVTRRMVLLMAWLTMPYGSLGWAE
jgi:hypothetical protein